MSQRTYGGVSSGDRVRQRREALVQAALDLVGDGLDPTVRSVCSRARLTPRYFYESFHGLDHLLVEVFDAVAEETLSTAEREAAAAPASLHERCRTATHAAFGVLLADPRKARLVLAFAQGHPVLAPRRRALFLAHADAMLGFVERIGCSFTERERARAVTLMMAGGAAELGGASMLGTVALDGEELLDTIAKTATDALVPFIVVEGVGADVVEGRPPENPVDPPAADGNGHVPQGVA